MIDSEYTATCHQRKIRDRLKDDHPVPPDFSTATVREISYQQAKEFILKYEWLGNMGTTVRAFGLFFGDELGAVECFGHPGSKEIKNICGKEHEDKIYWIARGACAPWVPDRGAASFIIARACAEMGKPWKTETGNGRDMPAKFAFLATADSDAGEIGQVYQSSNWLYLGLTTSDRMFLKEGQPKEKARSYRVLVKGPIRNRTGRVGQPDSKGRHYFLLDGIKYYKGDTTAAGEYIGGSELWPLRWNKKYGKTAKEAEAKRLKEVLAEGYREIKGNKKHLYIGIYGDKRMKRVLTAALTRKVLPYPKRAVKV